MKVRGTGTTHTTRKEQRKHLQWGNMVATEPDSSASMDARNAVKLVCEGRDSLGEMHQRAQEGEGPAIYTSAAAKPGPAASPNC